MEPDQRKENPHGRRPDAPSERYRLYIDESGDHVYRDTGSPAHRFLCLLGCWFKTEHYVLFQKELEDLKARHLPHHPDEPVVLHREDMLNARRAFSVLRDPARRAQFDAELVEVIRRAQFRAVAVVIDKQTHLARHGSAAAHPYHLALGFLLQRYAGYLNLIGRMGDVMAEARGGAEDRLLAESYERVFSRGAWVVGAHTFQAALSSSQLKLKKKDANVAGLQLADLLGHPVKQWTLRRYGLLPDPLAPFAQELMAVVEAKLNRHISDGRIDGYGVVLYPQ